jgi:hypothetical protein
MPPPSIIYAVLDTHTLTRKQPFFTTGCSAIFNNLNIAPPAGPSAERASVLRPFHHENWRVFKIHPTRVNQSKGYEAFSGHSTIYILFLCGTHTYAHTYTYTALFSVFCSQVSMVSTPNPCVRKCAGWGPTCLPAFLC